jgi:hypothetical protein
MKILVIEDSEKHINDAREFFQNIPEIEVVYVKSFRDLIGYSGTKIEEGAQQYLRVGKVDGVISDIYFPYDVSPNGYWQQEEPVGVMVMMLCRKHGIPCVLNTAGYHHGSKYQWIFELQGELGLERIVDASGDYFKEAETKNWPLAYKRLQDILGGGNEE